MENNIIIKNNIEKIYRGECTDFLLPNEKGKVISYLNKTHIKYNCYTSFEGSNKIIIYTEKYPNISLLEIKCNNRLKHSDILGALYNHNISIYKYGDIIVSNRYYIVVLDSIKKYLLYNLTNIGKYAVKLEEVSLELISNYKYEYDEFNILVSSLRVDLVVSSITNSSRSQVDILFKNKYILVNYEVINKKTYFLKQGDIISIRKSGKYKFESIEKITNKNKYVIKILKYK